MNDLTKRLLSATVGIALFIGIMFLPPIAVVIAALIISLGIVHEGIKAYKYEGEFYLIGILCTVVIFLTGMYAKEYIILAVLIAFTMIMVYIMLKHPEKNITDSRKMLFITIYGALATSYLGQIRYIDGNGGALGLAAFIYVFVLAWVSDSGAYFSGKLFGKRKLIPNISPNKTVEGAVGAVILTSIISLLYGVFVFSRVGIELNAMTIMIFIFLGVLGSMLGQVGDLIASYIKREAQIKDFGNIMPGHGGFFDRFDSVILIAPFAFYILKLVLLFTTTAL